MFEDSSDCFQVLSEKPFFFICCFAFIVFCPLFPEAWEASMEILWFVPGVHVYLRRILGKVLKVPRGAMKMWCWWAGQFLSSVSRGSVFFKLYAVSNVILMCVIGILELLKGSLYIIYEYVFWKLLGRVSKPHESRMKFSH